MSLYYCGPMPTTDEERATMRAQALLELRRLKERWEQTVERSSHGSGALLSVAAQESFNESVHKLLIATEKPDPGWYFYTARPIPRNKRHGRSNDGVRISALLTKVDIVLRQFDPDR